MRTIAFLMVLSALTGCVHVEQSLTINPDGSGTLEVNYGMPLETIAQMESLSQQASAMEGFTNDTETTSLFDFNEEDIRKDFKDYERHKVTLDSVQTIESNGWKYVNLKVKFAHLKGLSKTELIADRSISLTKNEDGSYVFKQTAPEMANDLTNIEGVDQAAIQAMMVEMMKGFYASLRVNTPGKVLETNAQRQEDQTAIWEFDLEKDKQALDRAQKLNTFVKFDGQGLDLEEFGGSEKKN